MPRHTDAFPFESVLSLEYLAAFWQDVAADEDAPLVHVARDIVERYEQATELHGCIHDPSVLDGHRDLLQLMMSAVVPPALHEEICLAVTSPFNLNYRYATPAMNRLRLFERGSPLLLKSLHLGDPGMVAARTLRAYYWIVRSVYGVDLPDDYPVMFSLQDEHTGLTRYYKLTINTRFARIDARDGRPELTPEHIKNVFTEPLNVSRWLETIPPDAFRFSGLVVMTAAEMTDQGVISALKDELLQKNALTLTEHAERLQHHLRSLLVQPDLQLGLICLEHDDIEGITGARAIGKSLLLSSDHVPDCPHKAESFYAQIFEHSEPIVVADLDDCDVCTGFEQHLRSTGIRTLLLAPLRFEDRVIGILELGSAHANALNSLQATKLVEVVGLFATAMKRMLDEQADRIQSIIKEHYTAIHPAVEWRFQETARRYLEASIVDPRARIEPVVFHDVFPLYGLSDVRSSSEHRSMAIQTDLLEQLGLALSIIIEASLHQPLPILDEISYRISQYTYSLGPEASTDDETSILDFLRSEVELLFPRLRQMGPRVRARIDAYTDALDPDLNLIFRQRRDFEESITLINDAVASYLNTQQKYAQEMFPHYFELFKTDGVDYNIYIGASMVEDGSYHEMYLRNLRLWQLITMCGVVWELNEMTPSLPMALETTHLILLQNTPLSICFRMEEKQFDVDGAYNIRYEIVKKRIDKAVILGTGERLTQPNKIAIVYSQSKEAQEYSRYLDYLTDAGYLTGDVEYLELEPMQGVHGLKAMRVTVSDAAPQAEVVLTSPSVASVGTPTVEREVVA